MVVIDWELQISDNLSWQTLVRHWFIQEQATYLAAELANHLHTGDEDTPGGHPACQFCKTRFYSSTGTCGHAQRLLLPHLSTIAELGKHLHVEHFQCQICVRRKHNPFRFYRRYDDLVGRAGCGLC